MPCLTPDRPRGAKGIFGTPVAVLLLAIEVLLFEWKPRGFVPVVVAVLVAFGWRPWLLGVGPLFRSAPPNCRPSAQHWAWG